MKSAMQHFSFTQVKNLKQFRITIVLEIFLWSDKLKTCPALLVLCRDYFNSIKLHGVWKCHQSQNNNVITPSIHLAHHKKVKHRFLNPDQFCQEFESEQKKHHGKCIYHLSISCLTAEC